MEAVDDEDDGGAAVYKVRLSVARERRARVVACLPSRRGSSRYRAGRRPPHAAVAHRSSWLRVMLLPPCLSQRLYMIHKHKHHSNMENVPAGKEPSPNSSNFNSFSEGFLFRGFGGGLGASGGETPLGAPSAEKETFDCSVRWPVGKLFTRLTLMNTPPENTGTASRGLVTSIHTLRFPTDFMNRKWYAPGTGKLYN